MKLNKLSALVAGSVLLASASTTVMAEGAWETSANVALSSEYVWRGLSQTNNDPALSGGFDIGHESGFYAGTWASNIDNAEGSIEVDYYAGFGGEFGDSGVSYDVGGLYYDFPGITEFDYFEVYAFVGYSFLSAGVSYSLDLFDADWEGAEDNVYYQLDAGYDIGSISLAAGIGHFDFDVDAVDDYTNWYVGASTEFAGLGFDISYHDTDVDDAEDTIVFTISKSL